MIGSGVAQKKAPGKGGFSMNPGDDLLSHTVTHAVSSALEGLTAVFGMRTGVSPPLQSPETRKTDNQLVINVQRVSGEPIRSSTRAKS